MLNRIRTILSVIIITALFLGSGLPFGEQPASAAEGQELDLSQIELPEKGNPKLDSQLNRLVSAETSKRAASFAQESNIELVEGKVRVIIESLPDQFDAANEAASAIGVVETSYRNLLQVVVPVSQLTALADTQGIHLVRMPWEPLPAVVSEGAALINADDWQTAGYNGTGVKVAILDGGFTGYSSLLGTELPASVTTQSFYAGTDIEGYSPHGTACAEIVYDIVPDADFYLVNFGNSVEMGNAVDWLIDQGVDVISYSMGWPIGGPGDGTGIICEMVDDARAAGILWSQSMGNSAQRHWQGDFNDPELDEWHNFSGTDISNAISVNDEDTIIAVLKWDDTWGASANDYDLYLIDNTSTIVWESTDTQDGNANPTEGFSYTANYTGTYHIAIHRYNATEIVNFHLYTYYDNLQYQVASSSFAVPADSPNAMAVGAVDYSTPSTLESFSSRGPTKDGRIKPDLVAPDGVSNATYGYFYGTSASAPHVAGAAALVKELYPSYTPAQIQAFLEGRAVDLGDTGKDNLFGSGRLNLGAPPAVTTNAANNVTTSSATLNGNLTSLGDYSSANVSFEWGTEPEVYSDNTTPQAMDSTGAFSDNLSGLTPSTTYYFRAKATSDNLTVFGAELNFTTLKALVSIGIAPDNPIIALGRSQQFLATGTYSDNSTDNITGTVTWGSDNTSVATIGEDTGFTQSLAEGQTMIIATSGNISDNTTLIVDPKVLDSIAVTPPNPSIAAGRTQQFTATGTYSDDSTDNITGTVTWTSDNTSVATIGVNTGLAQSLAEGQTTIIAALGGKSDNTTLTVGPKVLDTIAVTPPNPSIAAGRTQQFTATGTYSNNSTDNLTGSVNWSSSNTTVAIINAAGLATSYALGTANITATSGNISGNTTLTVNPAVLDSVIVTPVNPAIALISDNPPTLQFVATAVYSDGYSSIITSSANWTSDNTSVVTIGANTGLAATVAAGTTMITATYNGTSGNTTLTVLPDTVPPVVTLTSPTEGQVFSDNTTTVSGTVDDVNVIASVNVTTSVSVHGTAFPLTVDNVTGNFSKSVPLNTGSNTILVTAVDGNGNTGASGTITVVVDPNKPTITITQPVAGIVTDNSSLAVIGTVSGNVTTANLILNGVPQSVNVTVGSFSANIALVEGINILAINAYIAGHEGDSDYLGSSGVRMVTLDTTAPAVTIDSPVSESVVTTPGCKVSGTIDDPGVSTANLTLNGASQSIPVVGGSFSQNITLVSGNNTITVTATDETGNTSPADSVTVTFDNTKPQVTITAPANNLVTSVAGQAVTGTVSDPTITTATLYVNGTPQTISVTSNGSFSENVTLATGANTLEVRASDNGTSGVVNVTLDNTAPAITIGLSDPTDSITITVTSNEAMIATPTVSANSTVTIMPIDVNRWSGTYGSAGSPIAAGAYTVTANGTDKAGNTTTRIATFCKQTITISDNETETVGTDTVTLEISTTANVTDASISITQHQDNPSGNVGNPGDAEVKAGVFVEIVASPELRDNLEQIYMEVDYNPDDLPSGTDESTLKLYLWDVTSGTWQVVSGSGVNTTEHYIYGTVTHLSKYGGFGTVAAPPSPPPAGGGGGGGAPPGVTLLYDSIGSNGVFIYDVTARSDDHKCVLTIETNTIGLTKYGKALSRIKMVEVEEPPAPPEDSNIIGLVYDIGPDGATFEPAITVTISYDPEALPEGRVEDELYIAYWDVSQWLDLESTVDIEANTVSAGISHFTYFAVISKPPSPPLPLPPPVPAVIPAPASFAISNLSVTPSEVKPAEQVTISVVITNTGGSEGSYTVILKVNDAEEARKEVTLGTGKSKTVIFTIAKDTERSYSVDVNGEVGWFTVIVPPPPITTPTEVLPVQPPTNWWLIGGIIAGCVVVIGLLVYFFVWRKRGASQPS